MAQFPIHAIPTSAQALDLGSAKVYHLPNWENLSHPERLAVIRQLAMQRGRDPRIAQLATRIIRKSRAKPREYKKQAAALLKWVQNPKNVYYINEPGERLQDPIYTIKQRYADCDDMAALLCALFESVGLPWKLVLSGRGPQGKTRYIEGEPVPQGVHWSHIYCMVGDQPFRPSTWYFAEPTVDGVPLGWDVISGDHRYLPEMTKPSQGPPRIASAPKKVGMRPNRSKLPPLKNRSPAYDLAYGSTSALVSGSVGASIAEMEMQGKDAKIDWAKLGIAVVTGVLVSVGTSIALDWVRGKGIWEGKGDVLTRVVHKPADMLVQTSLFVAPTMRKK